MLKQHFSDTQQASRYRIELKNRRQRKGETLQNPYLDISRLVGLAHPGPMSEQTHRLAVEAFVDSLHDPSLEEKVADAEPRTLDQAYLKALKCESNRRDNKAVEKDIDRTDRPPKDQYVHVAGVEDDESDDGPEDSQVSVATVGRPITGTRLPLTTGTCSNAPVTNPSSYTHYARELQAIMKAVEANNSAVEQMKTMCTGLSADVRKMQTLVETRPASQPSSGSASSAGAPTCFNCGKVGHVSRNCRQ